VAEWCNQECNRRSRCDEFCNVLQSKIKAAVSCSGEVFQTVTDRAHSMKRFVGCIAGKSNHQQPVSCSGSEASPVKLKSPLHSVVFSPQVAALMPLGSDGSGGAFQMGRYMCDSGDSVRRSSAPDDPVDHSSILETFDPLGYAQNSRMRPARDVVEATADPLDVDAATASAAASALIVCSSDEVCSSVSGGRGNPESVQSTGSSASLVDIGLVVADTTTSAGVVAIGSSVSVDTVTTCLRDTSSLVDTREVATSSSVSVDTLTGCAREPAGPVDIADSCESVGGELSAVSASESLTFVSESDGARPKMTVSAPVFPPRISISHLAEGSIQSHKSAVVNGKLQSSGPSTELTDDTSSSVGRTTAFHVIPTRPVARAGVITATSSMIEGAIGTLNSRVSHCLSADFSQLISQSVYL